MTRPAWMTRAPAWLPAAVAIVLAAAAYLETRLWLLYKFPWFLDEGILGYYAQKGLDPDQRMISLEDGIRPGLVWLTLGGMRLHLGVFTSIRLAAVIFGSLTVIAGTILAYRLISRRAAVVYAVLALFTPYLFLYDALGLRDILIAGLLLSGFLLGIELARRPRLSIGLLLGLSFGGDLLIKDSGKAGLYLFPLSIVYFPLRSPRLVRRAAAFIGCAALAYVIAYVAILPLKLSSYYYSLAQTERSVGFVRPYSAFWTHPLRYFNEQWHGVHGELTSYLTWPIVVLALIGLVLGLWRRPRLTVLLAIWSGGEIASAIILATNLRARYVVPAVPFVLLLAAIGADELMRLVQKRAGAGRLVAAACAVVGVLLLVPALHFDEQMSFATSSAPYPPGDKVAFITSYASGYGTTETVDELATLANGQELSVLANPNIEPWQLLVLAQARGVNINWIWINDPDAATATAYLDEEGATPPIVGKGTFREIWQYDRPDGGSPIVLFAKS